MTSTISPICFATVTSGGRLEMGILRLALAGLESGGVGCAHVTRRPCRLIPHGVLDRPPGVACPGAARWLQVIVALALGRFPLSTRGGYFEMIQAIANEPAPTLSPASFTPELCSFVELMLRRDPAKRATARALLDHPFLVNNRNSRRLVGLVEAPAATRAQVGNPRVRLEAAPSCAARRIAGRRSYRPWLLRCGKGLVGAAPGATPASLVRESHPRIPFFSSSSDVVPAPVEAISVLVAEGFPPADSSEARTNRATVSSCAVML